MTLSRKDKDFRTNKTSYLEFKQIEMDRVLTDVTCKNPAQRSSESHSANG